MSKTFNTIMMWIFTILLFISLGWLYWQIKNSNIRAKWNKYEGLLMLFGGLIGSVGFGIATTGIESFIEAWRI